VAGGQCYERQRKMIVADDLEHHRRIQETRP
jgi:hypothetical protein